MARSRSSKASKTRTPEQVAGRRFLAASAVGALNTANARKPFAREGRASVPSFFSGWLTSELPLHAIGVQALATVGWARKGALKSPAGWLGLGVSAASWAGLYKVWQQAMAQGQIFDDALAEGLGEDLDAREPLLDPSGGEPVVTRQRIAAGPLTQWKKRYVSGPALSYGEFGRRNELDVWRRPDLPKDAKAPVLLQVHGGAWIVGNKDQQAMPLMAHLADRGWVCVSINYRLSPRSKWPDHIVDVKRAIAWIKDNIADYGGDPDFVAITGGSAGGHLSSLAALTANEPEFQPGFEDKDTSLVAAVPFYGVYDWTNRDGTGRSDMEDMLTDLILGVSRENDPDLWDHASTMTWVREDAPPFMVVHGTNDSLVPVEQARSFVAMMRAKSTEPVVYVELPGAQHAFEVFDSPRTIYSAGAVHRFLEAIRQRSGHRATIETPEPADAAAATEAPAGTVQAPGAATPATEISSEPVVANDGAAAGEPAGDVAGGPASDAVDHAQLTIESAIEAAASEAEAEAEVEAEAAVVSPPAPVPAAWRTAPKTTEVDLGDTPDTPDASLAAEHGSGGQPQPVNEEQATAPEAVKQSPAKQQAAKKQPAKKQPAKKQGAKKPAAKKNAGKKQPAKKQAAKKQAGQQQAGRQQAARSEPSTPAETPRNGNQRPAPQASDAASRRPPRRRPDDNGDAGR